MAEGGTAASAALSDAGTGAASGSTTAAAGATGAATGTAAPAWWGAQPNFGLDADTQGWLQSEGLHNFESVDKALPELVKNYRNTKAMVGRDKIVWPKDDADKPAWTEVYKRLGVPTDAKGYELQLPEGGDQEALDGVLSIFHQNNVPKGAAKNIVEGWNQFVSAKQQAAQAAIAQKSTAEFAAVRQEWGGEADRKFAASQHFARSMGLQQPELEAIETSLGTRRFLEIFSAAGMGMVEDRGPGGGGGGGFQTPEAASARKQELMKDQEWVKKYYAGDSVAVAEWNRLEQIQTSAMQRR
jgi:hypothetical protein